MARAERLGDPRGRLADALQEAGVEGPFAVSFAQERLWALASVDPGSPRYNEPLALWLRGPLVESVLAEALDALVARHATLRSFFAPGAGSLYSFVRLAMALNLERIDVRDAASATNAGADVVRRPFDLGRGPLIRAALLRAADGERLLVLGFHHAVTDGVSATVLVRELAELYRARAAGREAALKPLATGYADFALEERDRLARGELADGLDWWARRLAGAPPVLRLPTDHPRPTRQGDRGNRSRLRLGPELTARLDAVGRIAGATPFMVLLAGFCVLLGRYAGTSDVVVGALLDNRRGKSVAGVVGVFVNTVAIRVEVARAISFGALVRRVRDACVDAYAHGDVPFEEVVERIRPVRRPGHAPLVQVLFDLEPVLASERAGDLMFEPAELELETSKVDLTLAVRRRGDDVELVLEADANLLERDTAARMLAGLAALYAAACADPRRAVGQLPVAGAPERWLMEELNDTKRTYAGAASLHGLVEEQVGRTPEAIAVAGGGEEVSYGELNRRANWLARELRARGVGREVVVAALLERSAASIVVLLAVLKANGVYLPLDPANPAPRLEQLLADSGAALLVSRVALASGLDGPPLLEPDAPDGDWSNLDVPIRPGDAAYVMYTSGSTGLPKGVVVEQGSIRNLVLAEQELFTPGSGVRVAHASSPGFDASISEIFLALLAGGRLELAPGAAVAGHPLARALRDARVNTLVVTPTVLATLDPEDLPALRTIVLGGEPCDSALAERWLSGRHVLNTYGPTEGTIEATFADCVEGAAPTIGRPLPNVRVHVLDADGAPCPVGVSGEIHLAGAGVARGYLGSPELTAERFVPDPFAGRPGERMYRTGDLGRVRADGQLEFLGRLDAQVQVRGCRVEPAEVEAAVASHPGVRRVAVTGREGSAGTELVAHVVPHGVPPDPADLRRQVAARLPPFMVPARFVLVTDLPTTASGKLDAAALPPPERAPAAGRPRTGVEEVLAALWERTLDVTGIGPESDFFELGGHSLSAARLAAEIERTFGVDFPPSQLFESPGLERCAELVAAAPTSAAAPRPELRRRSRAAARPASYQERELVELDRLFGGRPLYAMPLAYRLRGPLDADALREALAALARRHDVLREGFRATDSGIVAEANRSAGFAWAAEEVAPDAVPRLLAREASCPFDLASGPFLRATLAALGPDDHLLVLVVHHVVADAWSVRVLHDELAALYAGAELPEPMLQYADYAAWQHEFLASAAGAAQLAHWRERLGGVPGARYDWERRGEPGMLAERLPFDLGDRLGGRVDAAARAAGATRSAFLLAALAALLRRHSDGGCVDVLVLLANRPSRLTDHALGMFATSAIARIEPGDEELVHRASAAMLDAHANLDVPFAEVARTVAAARDAPQSTLAPVLLSYEETRATDLVLPDIDVSELDLRGIYRVPPTSFHLIWTVQRSPHGLSATLDYNTGLFDTESAAAAVRELRAALEATASAFL